MNASRRGDQPLCSFVTEGCSFICLLLLTLLCSPSAQASISGKDLRSAETIIKKEIRSGRIPGAVLIVGTSDRILLRKAYGYRSLKPAKKPMSVGTIFDLASLTKVVATTTAVMKLADEGKLAVDDKVSKYWPDFGTNGKEEITVRHLLTHYSGLRPDLTLGPGWYGYDSAMKLIVAERPISPPGARFLYSDINFEVLGELVRRVSGEPLDVYCSGNIFGPLNMQKTSFSPDGSFQGRMAPTEFANGRRGKMLCGEVHDPSARRMGGVAGHAGLFSTADDLSLFARMLLGRGSFNGVRILDSKTVEEMALPQSPAHLRPFRGYGWSVDAPLTANRETLLPVGSYYHKGYTGTLIWIDPVTDVYVILLTNRVHPYGKGDAEPLRKQIINLVSRAVGTMSVTQVLARRESLASFYERDREISSDSGTDRVQTGIDVIEKNRFSELSGLRLGLITNHSGLDSAGRRTIDLLQRAPHSTLKAVFTPEHGLSGIADKKIRSSKEPLSGLPLYSLYGDTLTPTERMLDGVDALVFDVQDVGVRFYTYISTMAYAMKAASRKGIPFYVLDRPNPLNAVSVQGPVLDDDLLSFTGPFPLPVRHGMTVGELAEMFNSEGRIGARLHVIKMRGYRREQWFDETGLRWVNPSPNLRSLQEAILYPGTALAEGANISVGRGTATPFELLGAPWINAQELSSYLNNRKIKGVSFEPASFVPDSDIYKNQICNGVRISLNDRDVLDPTLLGLEIISALNKLYSGTFRINDTLSLIGSREVLREIREGENPVTILKHCGDDLAQFKGIRAKYLLY